MCRIRFRGAPGLSPRSRTDKRSDSPSSSSRRVPWSDFEAGIWFGLGASGLVFHHMTCVCCGLVFCTLASFTSFLMKGKCILPLRPLDLPICGMLNSWDHAAISGLVYNRKMESLIDSQSAVCAGAEKGRTAGSEMGHAPRRLVAALYVKPPWVAVEVRIGQKWRRANVLRQADNRGLCLVSIRGPPPVSDPIMVPLSTIRIPSNPPVARKTLDTRPNFRVKKPRIATDAAEGSSSNE